MFVFGVPKNARSTVDKDEEEALKALATELLSLSPEQLHQAIAGGTLIEVEDAEDQVRDS